MVLAIQDFLWFKIKTNNEAKYNVINGMRALPWLLPSPGYAAVAATVPFKSNTM